MSKKIGFLFLPLFLLFCFGSLCASPNQLILKNNLKRAQPGDFIVTAQNKTYTLLHIYDKTPQTLTIEEITVPEKKISLKNMGWGLWVQEGAPGHTSWVMYEVNLATAEMENYYSFSKNSWYNIPEADNFLSTLLNLNLQKIDERDRKKVGPSSGTPLNDRRSLWQPPMFVNGHQVKGVSFDAWKTYWPKDGSELSGKTIEVYTPQESDLYPSYFPYWLQISGMIGKAKVRIVDSGTNLVSPKQKMLH